MTHELKLNENFCPAVLDGNKPFEIRYNDRGYQTGDKVRFIPVDDDGNESEYCGELRKKVYKITYILSGWGLKEGYVVFGIREVEE